MILVLNKTGYMYFFLHEYYKHTKLDCKQWPTEEVPAWGTSNLRILASFLSKVAGKERGRMPRERTRMCLCFTVWREKMQKNRKVLLLIIHPPSAVSKLQDQFQLAVLKALEKLLRQCSFSFNTLTSHPFI